MAATMAVAAGFSAGWLLGARRIVVAAKAPAGDAVAFVLEGRCAAGLCQTLRIGPSGSSARVVESLSGPEEQATEVAWAPDGGRVGFLVNGYQLRVFDALVPLWRRIDRFFPWPAVSVIAIGRVPDQSESREKS